MKYQTIISSQQLNQHISNKQIQIYQYKYQQTGKQQIKIKYQFTNELKNKFSNLKEIQKIKVKFGRKDQKDKFGRFSIFNFNIQTKKSKNYKNLRQTQSQKHQLTIFQNYDHNQGSFPLIYYKQYHQQKGVQYFKNLIKQLPTYYAINKRNDPRRIYICHDMKGGYIQETSFTNSYSSSRITSYRFNHFWQTNIFNYFSHKTISIPPKHWRILCQRYKTKCLGTFIVQPEKIQQEVYLTDQYVYKLVYIAKKYKFDGYLLNIETVIKNIPNLELWIQKLTYLIHIQIPGSQITWYDSVSVKGLLQYQNQVNANNRIFYQLADSFYTNYWWTDELLKDDLSQIKQNKVIYVGNDVWGRGTAGGGQYNLYKAIYQIQKYLNPNLGVALFGPAYTYEKGGQNNSPLFKINQDKLYRGVINESFILQPYWFPTQSQQTNKDTQFVRSTKMNLIKYIQEERIRINLIYKINQLFNQINSTFHYKIQLKVYDQRTNKKFASNIIQVNQCPLSLKSSKKLSLLMKTKKITAQTILQIIQTTSIKNVFEKQQVIIQIYHYEYDWTIKVPYSKIKFGQNFNSFFNIGHGDNFFYQGTKIYQKYDYMADYDLPHTSSLNNPLLTDFQYDDSFIGGSCLMIQPGIIKLLSFQFSLNEEISFQKYLIKIVSKLGNIRNLFISQQNGNIHQIDKIYSLPIKNGWIESLYQISMQKINILKSKFYTNTQTFLYLNVQSKILIGQLSLEALPLNYIQKQKQFFQIQLFISESFKSHAELNSAFFNIQVVIHTKKEQQKLNQRIDRLLLIIDNKYVCFMYLDQKNNKLKGRMDQIFLKNIEKPVDIKLKRIYGQQKQTIFQKVDLLQIIKNKLGYRIHLKSY